MDVKGNVEPNIHVDVTGIVERKLWELRSRKREIIR